MRVCADPDQFPASARDQPGFENRIAEIVADQLDAELSYVWTRANQLLVRDHLWPGECDVAFGVSEGTSGLLNTVPYYRVPYVFVYRKDARFEIESLDDEILDELTITTYPSGPPHRALLERGLQENIVFLSPNREGGRLDRDRPIIEALLDGDADLGILSGAAAGYYAKHLNQEIEVLPVTPQIAPPHFQMFRTVTAGVRPGDKSFRDRLNIALAERWEEIQAVFAEFGVPVLTLPPPRAPVESGATKLRIGAVLPIPTGRAELTDRVATAAQLGSIMAENQVPRERPEGEFILDLLLASAPSEKATVRAAERLIETESVTALLGGTTPVEARTLSRIAEERGVLFFNIATMDSSLRGEHCASTTFHIEASSAMYLDALVTWFNETGHRSWFVLYEDSEHGEALFQQAKRSIEKVSGEAEIAGSSASPPGLASYQQTTDEIAELAPDVILLLLGPEEQEMFLAQFQLSGLDQSVTGLAHPVMQTREFIGRLRQVSPPDAAARPALWDPRLESYGANELNQTFTSRSGDPMDPPAWAAYAAVKVLFDAVVATGTTKVPDLISYLESPDTVFDLHKGPGISFRSWNHQLRQPLYLISMDPEAEWGRLVSQQIELAQLLGQVPEVDEESRNPRERLDLLGEDQARSECGY